jgi:transposase
MTEPTACCAARCPVQPYCGNCDLLVGLQGLHVLEVQRGPDQLRVTVESEPSLMGCPACGVVAVSHGRRDVLLIDAPSFGRPVRLVWRKRTWCCLEPLCPAGTFTEQHHDVAAPRALLTVRACWWAITQLRREHASISGLARQLGTSWRTVWRAIRPLLQAMDADPTRFEAVTTLGVDEHIWHHVSITERGPKELTGMVDLTRDEQGNTRARLLDLVPGRSGAAYGDWLTQRGQAFRDRVEVATLDPFHGYKNAIDDRLQDASATPSTRCAVGSSRRPSGTVAGRGTRCTASGTSCGAGRTGSPSANVPVWTGPSPPTNATRRSTWPGRPSSDCARSSTRTPPSRGAASPSTS